MRTRPSLPMWLRLAAVLLGLVVLCLTGVAGTATAAAAGRADAARICGGGGGGGTCLAA
ncbi:MAG: hypothetical protein QM729_06980 [Solirubrobacterales bacterium]